MVNPLHYFFVGLAACFIGTIPFGPINMSVVKATVDYDRRRGIEVALAASIVEIFQALIAISFGLVISRYLDTNFIIQFFLAFIFIVLAIFVVTRKPRSSFNSETNKQGSFFRKGLLIAALNPQAIPFWIFALASISQYFAFEYVGIYLLSFLLAVFIGKFAALYCFVVASSYLKTHLQESGQFVNRLLAAILLLIGLSQAWNGINRLLP